MLALSVFYTAGTFLNGIISAIAMVLFTIEVIAGIIILFVKFHKIKVKDNTSVVDAFMTCLSTGTFLWASYLFLDSISYEINGIFDTLVFVVGLLFFGVLWFLELAAWLEAVRSDEFLCGFNYYGFLKQLGVVVVYVVLYFVL